MAGGLYLMPRGVRGSARGGATVAGSTTPHALWYNPAGLLESKRQLLVDFVAPIYRSSFTRRLDNGIQAPKVSSTSVTPIPTLAYSDNFGLEDWGFGVGLIVPPGSGASWPETVDGRPAPQRYSILNTDGSYIASLALGAAYTPAPNLVLGAAVYLTSAQVNGTVAFSACEYVVCTQPEAIEWQGKTRFMLGPLTTATAIFGASYATPHVKVGASVQLKTTLEDDAKIEIAMPDSDIFDDIVPENEDGSDDLRAGFKMVLPTIMRLGIEVYPIEPLSVELAGSWERWSSQKEIEIRPRNIVARDVPGVGDITAEPVGFALNMRDTWSISLGGSYDLSELLPKHRAVTAHMGGMYEAGAFADEYMSPTSLDTNKLLLSLGATVAVTPNVFIDAVYGHIFMQNRHIRNSKVLLPAAIQPAPVDDDPGTYEVGDVPTIGNGRYTMEADYLGVAVRWTLDPFRSGSEETVIVTEPAPAAPQAAPEAEVQTEPAAPPAAAEPVITPIEASAEAEAEVSTGAEVGTEAAATGEAETEGAEVTPEAPTQEAPEGTEQNDSAADAEAADTVEAEGGTEGAPSP